MVFYYGLKSVKYVQILNKKPPAMRVRQRKLYKKITLLKYNVGVQAALYAKER